MAIVHFTAPPAIGGIESLMARQCDILQGLGHGVVFVVGRGSGSDRIESIEIPAMDPSDEAIAMARSELQGARLTHHHPLVKLLIDRLGRALQDCTDCWVHNALTVSLNPFLTSALEVLIGQRPEIGWVAWSEDLSCTSRFTQAEVESTSSSVPRAVSSLVTWVAVSQARRRELGTALGIPGKQVRVVYPPLDIPTWLDVGSQVGTVLATTKLLACELVILVPAKALPHKCLDRAVAVGAALARSGHDGRVLITAATSPHEPSQSARVRYELRRSIQAAGVEASVYLLPELLGTDPTDRTVRELMHLSDVVLVPSIEEGFGMPLLEAAACRVPVVCTDIPVFREVGGDSALYFDENWSDEQVISLLLAAIRKNGNPQRRAALTSMQRFQVDVETILRMTAHPKV